MIKIFISFIALISFATRSYANLDPEVFIGGMFNFNSALVGQETEYTQTNLPHNQGAGANKNSLTKDNYLSQEAFIDLLVIGKSDTATLYGARAVMQLDSQRQHVEQYDSAGNLTYNDNSKAVYTRRAYMFLEKKSTGRLEFGDVEGASKKLKFDASYRFGGSGGIAGNWWKYVNIPDFGLKYGNAADANDVQNVSGKGNMSFIIRPDLPMSHGYNVEKGADKFDDTRTIARVSYYSPRISGMQFGISYAPDSGDRGASYYGHGYTSDKSGDVKDIIDWGINYIEQFDEVGIAFSFTGELGYAEDTTVDDPNKFVQQDLSSYAIGSYIFIGNFSLSGSYGLWNDSLMQVRSSLVATDNNYRDDEANYVTAGFGYQFGPFKFGVSHLGSSYREQDFSLISTAFDYRMTKNMSLYAEFNQYEFNAKSSDTVLASPSAGQTVDNEGEVILLGAKMIFGGFDNASQILLDTSQSSY